MENLREVLAIDIRITGADEVKGTRGEALMIHFDGTSECENFKGIVLPGGVDTQKEVYGEKRWLSARYILDGVDGTGEKCRIFIENNGAVSEDGTIITKPVIFTDSKRLTYLETADLRGTIEGIEGGVRIHISMSETAE